MYLGRESFFPQTAREAAKELFKRNVRRVEVETHSYCNRRCAYCPNVVGDRLGDNKRIAGDVWSLVLRDLTEIGYADNFVFSGYNEPLSDKAIVERIRETHAALPKAHIMTYTNGDYLTPSLVDDLATAGLQYMHVSIHMGNTDKYSDIYALDRISEVTSRIGLPAKFKTIRNNEFTVAKVPHKSIDIEIRAINYWKHGTDRGGLLDGFDPEPARTAPCHYPFNHFQVGFEGTVVPCCHIRSDNEQHRPHRYGNVRDYGSIFEMYASRAATQWRRHLISSEEKEGPCRTCTAPFLSDSEKDLAATRSAWRQFVRDTPLPEEGGPAASPAAVA
jgi:hypothetical protein